MYSIALLKGGADKRDALLATLQAAITKDGRFRVHCFAVGESKTTRADRQYLTSTYGGVYASWFTLPSIFLQGPSGYGGAVRLTTAKLYCGNHPGPCEINPYFNPPKKNSTSLEWEDWVQFHTLVNKVCNRLAVHANVWTNPQDAKGRFWIRRGTQARLRWDYTEEYVGGRPFRMWNTGTPDQFQQEV